MNEQLSMGFDRPERPERRIDKIERRTRRIDKTFENLDASLGAMSAEDQARLSETRSYHMLIVASRLRSMEISEAEAMPGRPEPLADIYDQMIAPGEHAGEAVLRVLAAYFSNTPPSAGDGNG